MFVCLSARISAALNGRITAKFGVGELYDNMSRKYNYGYNLTKTSGMLHEQLHTFHGCWQHKFAITAPL